MRTKEVSADDVKTINTLLDKGYYLYRAFIDKGDGKPRLLMIKIKLPRRCWNHQPERVTN